MKDLPSFEEFIEILQINFGLTITLTSDTALVTAHNETPVKLILNRQDYDKITKSLMLKEEVEELGLVDLKYFETLIKISGIRTIGWPFRLHMPMRLVDNENNLTYILDEPNDEYLLYLICRFSSPKSFRSLFNLFRLRQLASINRFNDGQDEVTLNQLPLFDILRKNLHFKTLRIESHQPRKLNEFISYADSFFFHVAFNLDISIVKLQFLEDNIRRQSLVRSRTKIKEIEAPKRIYQSDLVYHYQLAVASTDAALQYLSYYHVIEHFFEIVFNKDLIEKVRNKITLPSFSYKRDMDVKELIKLITQALKSRDEDVIFSEKEALKLTLKRYLNIEDLLIELRSYDNSLVDFYRDYKVSFAPNASIVDFNTLDYEAVYSSLASRIYQTRNAIVHSKDGDKGKYVPFTHDRDLVKEVPLIRIISEQIIIKTAKVI